MLKPVPQVRIESTVGVFLSICGPQAHRDRLGGDSSPAADLSIGLGISYVSSSRDWSPGADLEIRRPITAACRRSCRRRSCCLLLYRRLPVGRGTGGESCLP